MFSQWRSSSTPLVRVYISELMELYKNSKRLRSGERAGQHVTPNWDYVILGSNSLMTFIDDYVQISCLCYREDSYGIIIRKSNWSSHNIPFGPYNAVFGNTLAIYAFPCIFPTKISLINIFRDMKMRLFAVKNVF